ncbi:MAG: aminotransferase class IV [Chloroflexi bacterium]|nr:aminotransferase class IV [Chloroflexota bacterium]
MSQQRELVSYLNGRIMPHSQAVALLQRESAQSAGGFYDAERTFSGRVFKLPQHLQRLYNGLGYSQIDAGLTLDEMERVTLELLEANRALLPPGEEFTITQVVSLAQPRQPDEKPPVNVVIYFQRLDFRPFARSYQSGVRLVTPATYGMPEQAVADAKEGGQQIYPLMTSREGSITECQGANFMFARDGRIKLPDRSNVLPGVSMQTVLELAASLGIPVDEGDYSPYDVYVADEAFISSTRYCMLPVATLNGYSLGRELPGPLTRRIMDAWRALVGVDFVQQALDHIPQ